MMSDVMVDVRLMREPLDSAAAVAWVSCPEAGGIALFLGTTRAENAPAQTGPEKVGPLMALDYHAYDEMAVSQIQKLVAEAQTRWPICRVAIWHRLGEVRVGEPSVAIAVSTPHRGEAFDACEFLIDELKKLVPIWKKEIYEGATRWQEAR